MNDEKNIPQEHDHFELFINDKKYGWPTHHISGIEIKELGMIPKEEQLFLIKRNKDELVHNDTILELKKVEIDHFFSQAPITMIIVNAREKPWIEKEIAFNQVVELAFGPLASNANTVFTVTYKHGPKRNPEGSMSKGDSVFVKNKMIFNVTATDKS